MTIDELEGLRRKITFRMLLAGGIAALIAVAVMVIMFSSLPDFFSDSFIPLLFPIMIGIVSFCILYGIICHRSIKHFKTCFKQTVVVGALCEHVTIIDYDPNGYFTQDFIKSTYMVATGNRFSGDDLLRAEYKNIPFQTCDLLIQNHTSSGKSSSTVTYFKGKWFVFDFPKFKDLYLRIAEKRGNAHKAGTYFSELNAEKILFENQRFNSEFEVKCTDRHMAFYIVTPVFMEDMQKLSALSDGQLIVGVKDGKLHVALHTNRNSMEPSIFKKVDQTSIREIEDEIKRIIGFIDHLIENKKLFGNSQTAKGENK